MMLGSMPQTLLQSERLAHVPRPEARLLCHLRAESVAFCHMKPRVFLRTVQMRHLIRPRQQSMFRAVAPADVETLERTQEQSSKGKVAQIHGRDLA